MAQPDAKRQKLDYSEGITVKVGAEQKQFLLHKCFATKTSEFFRAATTEDWKEGKVKEVTLPETEANIFAIYFHWLYTGEVVTEDDGTPTASKETRCANMYPQLVDAYILACYVRDYTFQNAIIDRFLQLVVEFGYSPGASCINNIWDKTPDRCGLKRLLVRYQAKNLKKGGVAKLAADIQPKAMHCVIEDLTVLRDSGTRARYPCLKWKCDYHEHDEKTPKKPECTPK